MMKKYIKYMASLLAVSFAMSACIDLEEMNVDLIMPLLPILPCC